MRALPADAGDLIAWNGDLFTGDIEDDRLITEADEFAVHTLHGPFNHDNMLAGMNFAQ
jgi:hypothetical protein